MWHLLFGTLVGRCTGSNMLLYQRFIGGGRAKVRAEIVNWKTARQDDYMPEH